MSETVETHQGISMESIIGGLAGGPAEPIEGDPGDEATEDAPATDGGEPEEEAAPGVLDDNDEDDDSPEVDGDEAESGVSRLSLSEEVAKALPEDVRKRYENHVKGVEKLERQVAERESVVSEFLDSGVRSYLEAFKDPEHWRPALEKLSGELASFHGTQPASLPTSGEADWEAAGFLSEGEYRAFKKAEQAEQLARQLLDKQTAAERTAQEAKVLQEKASGAYPRVKAEYGSWVTAEMVKDAVVKHPSLAPIDAFAAVYRKEIARNIAEYQQTLQRKPKREGISGVASREPSPREPGAYVSMMEIIESGSAR